MNCKLHGAKIACVMERLAELRAMSDADDEEIERLKKAVELVRLFSQGDVIGSVAGVRSELLRKRMHEDLSPLDKFLLAQIDAYMEAVETQESINGMQQQWQGLQKRIKELEAEIERMKKEQKP